MRQLVRHVHDHPRRLAAAAAVIAVVQVAALAASGTAGAPQTPPARGAPAPPASDADPTAPGSATAVTAAAVTDLSLPDAAPAAPADTADLSDRVSPEVADALREAPDAVAPGEAESGAAATSGASARTAAAGSYPDDPARERFERRFPAQARAGQNAGRDPATARWAVLVGINDHEGRTRDNLGSRQDAEDLHAHLRYLGWRDDHIVLLTDRLATKENIIQAIAWLGRKTNENSVAVFSYSGHTKQWRGRDVDGDGEVTDEGLWPSDNEKIVDSEFVHRLTAVRAGRFWVNIGACEAAGFADPGIRRPGRVLTFSSEEPEKSYEDPSVNNQVWAYYLVDRGMRAGEADRDGDGDVTVEEAFVYARPRAAQRTAQASHGSQNGVVIDDLRGEFSLAIPPPPRQERDRDGGGDDDDDATCVLGICDGATPPRSRGARSG